MQFDQKTLKLIGLGALIAGSAIVSFAAAKSVEPAVEATVKAVKDEATS